MTNRRSFLLASTCVALSGMVFHRPGLAAKLTIEGNLRGGIDASKHGMVPNGNADQSAALQKLLDRAASEDLPVFIPPGHYQVSNINLPDRTRIAGVAGASRFIYGGGGHMLTAAKASIISLTDIDLDGGNLGLDDTTQGLVHLSGVSTLTIENCRITNASKYGLWAEKCSGRITETTISGAGLAGIFVVDSFSLSITANTVTDCGNGGILVHRWQKGEDGTLVSSNHVSRIHALAGGTGQNGNGINVFRADNVLITANIISDCAFSAIRSNAGSAVQILGNQCLRSGETAIYSEFGFEGAIIANNMVDGAANGVSVVNFNEGGRLATITGNIIRNMSLSGPYPAEGIGFGIGLSAEAETTISGNVIEGAAKWGMALGWGPYLRNISVTGNIVRASPIGIAVSTVDGIGSALISSNQFSETNSGAIVGFHWNEPVTGELAGATTAADGHILLANNQSH